MGLEEKKTTFTALPSQSAEASQFSLKNIEQQPFLSDLPGGRKILQVNKNDLLSSVFVRWTLCLQKSDPDNHIKDNINFRGVIYYYLLEEEKITHSGSIY